MRGQHGSSRSERRRARARPGGPLLPAAAAERSEAAQPRRHSLHGLSRRKAKRALTSRKAVQRRAPPARSARPRPTNPPKPGHRGGRGRFPRADCGRRPLPLIPHIAGDGRGHRAEAKRRPAAQQRRGGQRRGLAPAACTDGPSVAEAAEQRAIRSSVSDRLCGVRRPRGPSGARPGACQARQISLSRPSMARCRAERSGEPHSSAHPGSVTPDRAVAALGRQIRRRQCAALPPPGRPTKKDPDQVQTPPDRGLSVKAHASPSDTCIIPHRPRLRQDPNASPEDGPSPRGGRLGGALSRAPQLHPGHTRAACAP